jgi:ATP-dependent DNA helicase RecQ
VAELGGISGVGEKKLATYGEGVVAVLAGLDGPSATAAGHPDTAAGHPESAAGHPESAAGHSDAAAGHPGEDHWPTEEPEPDWS